jgi:small-conductance mechanosensitive channel/CRP-like cAMP-binding protein
MARENDWLHAGACWKFRRLAMALLQRLLAALLGAALLLVLQRLLQPRLRQRGLPRLPLGLPALALVSWTVLPAVEALGVASDYWRWLDLVDELLIGYAGLRLGLWLGLQLPGGLGWWRRPPDLLVQLVMLGGGALLTVLVVRESARFDLVGLVTTSAVLTAVVGFAAQESLKDLFAGLELQLGDDFAVGDWLDLGQGVQGVVESITWRDTQLRDVDGCRVIIPNSRITAEVISNRSASGVASNRFELGLDYDFPPAQARALLEGVVQQHPLVVSQPAPRVRIKAFADSAITYELQVWQREMSTRAILELRSALLEQIWYALQRAGQSIPFPVRELQPRRRTREAATAADHGALELSGLFQVLPLQQRQQLAMAGRVLRFGPGEAIVREGETGDCLYQLLAGRVEVLKAVSPGRQVSVRQLEAGDLFGEMTLLLDSPRTATVRAMEECQLLQLDRAAVAPLLQDQPELLQQLADQVSRRRQELEQLNQAEVAEEGISLLGTMRRLFQAVTGNSSSGP